MKVLDKLNNSTNNSNAVEVWKPIKGYEGYYEVSSLGRVRRVARIVKTSDGRIFNLKEKSMTPVIRGNGYLGVHLRKGKIIKAFYIHRLVALAFIPNPDPINKTQTNHRNECKTDNRVDNLNWLSPKENINYGTRTERQAEKMRNHKSLSKQVA